MGFFDKVKCLAGSHDWPSWAYQTSGSCEQQRSCKREKCSKSESQTTHNWGAFSYVSDDSCQQKRSCARCQKEEKQKAHATWSQWDYDRPDKCFQTRTCGRCKEDDVRVEHRWDVWNYESPTSCVHVRFCRRCHDHEGKQPRLSEHDWGEPQRISCWLGLSRCQRCAETKPESVNMHVWGSWERNFGEYDKRTCRECGDVEQRRKN
jgi:hypothetical protein